jgi:replicative DNA helicase
MVNRMDRLDSGPRRNSRSGGGGGSNGATNRIPPHNLQAEESVLGAILLSRDALGSVIEQGLRYDDFYKPAHQHIYDAACAVSQSGGPADTITVADELERLGLLEQCGGVEALHGLQNATPAISNAGHYAKIVQDAAMLRRLIMVSGDITELAYSRPENVDDALDEAETKIFKVADRRVSDTYIEIGELMKGAIERIEENFTRGDTITGVATGYSDLDEMLSGLQPSTLNIVGARPAMGKCLKWDSPMIDVVTGEVVTAAQLFELGAVRDRLDVLSLEDDGRMRTRPVSVCLDDGIKPVFKVTTRSGRTVSVTASHPLLTAQGWRPLREIEAGDHVAMPAALPVFGVDDLPDEEIDLLGLLIGDGSLSSGSPVLTASLGEVVECCRSAADRFGVAMVPAGYSGLASMWRLAGPGYGRTNPVTDMLRRHEMWGKTAHHKFIPPAVFRLPRHRLARFLNRLFATDGTAWVAKAGYARIGYSSASLQLARDVQHALTRFGIRAKLRARSMSYQHGRRPAFEVEVMDAPSLIRFCDEIGILGKDLAVSRVRAKVAFAQQQFSLDVVPAQVWVDIEKAKGDISWAEINRRCGRPPNGNWHRSRRGPLRRETVAQLAEALDCDQLRWWASPDISWDRVVSIEPEGEARVIDFTVPGTHNFVAADLFLHNTAFGLGMATHIAKTSNRPVLVFSLEMGHVELTQRILSSESEVDSTKIRNGKLSESDWAKIGRAIGRLEVPLYLDDNPRVTVMEIRAKARRLKMQRGDLGMIMIDYLQLMSGSANAENRQLEVSEISRNLKILARELEVPIVALSQLSRNLEARSDKRPMLSDLRESGSLEQDSDVVMFLYRDEVYNKESPDRGAAEVLIAKHRAGPIGDVRLVFRGQYTRFDNAAPRSVGP